MADEKATEASVTDVQQKTRRSFVTTAAQVAVTAPAVIVLLNASSVRAQALPYATNNSGSNNSGSNNSGTNFFDGEADGGLAKCAPNIDTIDMDEASLNPL